MSQKLSAVLTGQQIAPLLGPLYTPLKIMGAIKKARALGTSAVYWMEGNDADFEEIRHWQGINKLGKVFRSSWDSPSQGHSLAYLKVDEALIHKIKDFFQGLTQTTHTPSLLDLALRHYKKDKTLLEANRSLASEIFEPYPLELFSPSDNSDFIDFSQGYLRQELEKTPVSEQAAVFYLEGEKRQALFRTQTAFENRQGKVVPTHKVRLLPALKTRSVIQDAFFPASHYIAGPGEEAYLADMTPQYSYHKVQAAEVVPRMRLRLLDTQDRQKIGARQLTEDDFFKIEASRLKKRWLENHGLQPSGVTEQKVNKLFQELEDELKLLNPRLIQRQKDKLLQHLSGAKRKQLKHQFQRELNSIDRLSTKLLPYGKPAERVLNSFYYFNRYGLHPFLDFIDKNYHFGETTLEFPHD